MAGGSQDPVVPSARPPGMEQAGPAIDDPEPYVRGSFDEVFLAYDLGQLSDADYAVALPQDTVTRQTRQNGRVACRGRQD